jgi:hypothetical protein
MELNPISTTDSFSKFEWKNMASFFVNDDYVGL